MDERLFALAVRLDVPEDMINKCRDPNYEEEEGYDDLWKWIGHTLGLRQPEFSRDGPGRPRGGRNKLLGKTTNRETLRKRRQRDKRRKKPILNMR
jgi:hypothetical protein